MATTTTNFGWDIPQSTDLVKDGATAIAALGQDIDTALVDLKGGTTGQVLAKASNTDLDYSWVAQDDSNAIQNAIMDAKGDLIGATAADTPARLAVGTNGQVLTADSTAATGLAWATPAGPTFVGAQIYDSNATQSISSSTFTAVTFNSEVLDTDGFHSTSSNTSRMTIPAGKAGKYMVVGQIFVQNNGNGTRRFEIYKNGSSFARTQNFPDANEQGYLNINTTMNLAVSDYVELYVYQNSGVSLNIYGGSAPQVGWFNITYLGA